MKVFIANKLAILFGFWLFLSMFASSALAIAKFNTNYQVYYKVDSSGGTHVNFVISQKNNLSIVYATEFGISINETRIANLKITDEGQVVTPVVQKNQNQTVISFPFAKKVVGKDKVHNFSIEYDTSDIVSKQGNTWQISIPRFESDENVTDQTAILSLPSNFPQPAYIDPRPDIVNGSTYYFSSKILANKPISAIFGKNQFYKGTLQYFVKNNNDTEMEIPITLIPNTAYQKVYYEKIDPLPQNIEIDEDGNLIAVYELTPGKEINVNTNVFIKTDFKPTQDSIEKRNSYLENNKIWNYDNNIFTIPEIKNLTSPKSIYDYVVNKLKYDYQKINPSGTSRDMASDSLKNYLSAICTDYTDLFISLARKARIPARELEGLAVSENPDLKPISDSQDVLHAWPEYYDEAKKQWIQIDPTWGSTTRGLDYFNKLDFNHIVFAIHGLNPEFPPPAGSYRKPGSKEKDLNFEAIEEISFPQNDLVIEAGTSTLTNTTYTIKNKNGIYFSGNLDVPETKTTYPQHETINIPPLGKKQITLKNKALSFLFPQTTEVIINLNGKDYAVKGSTYNLFQKSGFFAIAGLILGSLTLLARSLFFRRQK